MNAGKLNIKALAPKGDRVIWILVVLFAMVSILAVFSSSTYRSNKMGVDKDLMFFEQVKFAFFGLVVLIFCYLVPMKFYRFFAFTIASCSVLLLLMTFIPHFKVTINGATRGIQLFGINFQVFEMAKIGLILYLSKALEKWSDTLYTFKDFAIKFLLPILGVCLLVVVNSASHAILFGLIAFLLLFIMQVDLKYLGISIAGIILFVALLLGIYNLFYKDREYEPDEKMGVVAKFFNRFGTAQNRVANFVDEVFNKEKEDDAAQMTPTERRAVMDNKLQSENAKIAISEGGLIGKGPGKSTQRYSLPMAFSDFIYAFIVEEYGLLGGAFVIMLYIWFIFRCIRISTRCKTTFSCALVVGLSFLIVIQAMLHIMVNVRLLPITGHTLPLISQGGTAYIIFSGAVGMILSVSRTVDNQDKALRKTAADDGIKEIDSDEETACEQNGCGEDSRDAGDDEKEGNGGKDGNDSEDDSPEDDSLETIDEAGWVDEEDER